MTPQSIYRLPTEGQTDSKHHSTSPAIHSVHFADIINLSFCMATVSTLSLTLTMLWYGNIVGNTVGYYYDVMTFDLDIWHADSSWLCLYQFQRSRSKFMFSWLSMHVMRWCMMWMHIRNFGDCALCYASTLSWGALRSSVVCFLSVNTPRL